MPIARLLLSAHNHLFGFSVLALLLALGLCLTRLASPLRGALIVAAFGGAAIDIAGWFITRTWGSPFHWMILIGGGLFGLSTALMALLILRDAVAGSLAPTAREGDGAA